MVVANDLADLITAAVKQGSEKKIYLSADLRARNRDVQAFLIRFELQESPELPL
jgi:hypothetical protein